MELINRIRERLLYFLFFFCITFNTVYIGPNILRLNSSRLIFILIAFFSVFSLFFKRKIQFVNTTQRNFIIFIILWIVYGFFISVFVSIDISVSYRYIFQLFLFFIIYSNVSDLARQNDKLYEKCINAFLVGLVVNNVFAWYELFTSNYLFLVTDEYVSYYIRHNYALTFFGNPNNLCTVLTIGCLLCIVKYSISNKKIVKFGMIALIISSVLIMIRDYSEANIIGLILGALVFFVFKRNNSTKIKPGKIVLLCIGGIVSVFLLDQIFSYLIAYYIRATTLINISDSTLGARISYSQNAIYNMLNKNIFGVGLGNSKYYSLWTIGEAGNVHNWFTEIFVDTGVFVFLIYVFFYITVIKHALNNSYIKNNYLSMINLGSFSIMIAFIIFNISSSSLLPSDFMWCVFALIYSIVINNINKEDVSLNEN